CDFCDEPYKVAPSAKLLQLRSQLLLISTLASNFINPAHRIIYSASRLVAYCKQHNIDATLMPAARANGWPEYINFAELAERTQKLVPDLQNIVEAIDCSPFFEAASEFKKATAYLQYWFFFTSDSLDSYGERGYQLIYPTLRFMFPESPELLAALHPLTYDILVREVLIPEATIRLIASDLHVSPENATAIRKMSHEFGLILHPADDNCPFYDRALTCITNSHRRDNWALRVYEASGSELPF
ncbi:hypothetical protein C8R45DRAFT_849979, partial [Mycena sanguinolenta]